MVTLWNYSLSMIISLMLAQAYPAYKNSFVAEIPKVKGHSFAVDKHCYQNKENGKL